MAPRARTTFGPVVLAGIATAALTAVAASQTWLRPTGELVSSTRSVDVSGSDAAPLALALALVALAGWGVVLVSGTRARRVALLLGTAACLGVLAVVVASYADADAVATRMLDAVSAGEPTSLGRQAWYWITGVAAAAQAAVLVVAFRAAPTWPTMSSRYDAPAARGSSAVGGEEDGENAAPLADLDLWKALDEGRDPTTRRTP